MSSGSSSHLSKSKQDDDPRHSIEQHSSSVSPLGDGAVESAFVPSSTHPYEADSWKQNFTPYYHSECVVPAVSQNSSLLSQICEDSDPLHWGLTPQSVNFEQKSTQSVVEVATEETPTKSEMDEKDSKKEAEKEKNRARMRRLRAARDQEKIESDREKARERTRRVRAAWNEERRQRERQRAREYMRKRRAMKAKQNGAAAQRHLPSPEAT